MVEILGPARAVAARGRRQGAEDRHPGDQGGRASARAGRLRPARRRQPARSSCSAAIERAVSLRRYYLSRGRVDGHDRRAGGGAVRRPRRQPARRPGAGEPDGQRRRVGGEARGRTVRVRFWRAGGSVHVEMADSGAGFEAAMDARVGRAVRDDQDDRGCRSRSGRRQAARRSRRRHAGRVGGAGRRDGLLAGRRRPVLAPGLRQGAC